MKFTVKANSSDSPVTHMFWFVGDECPKFVQSTGRESKREVTDVEASDVELALLMKLRDLPPPNSFSSTTLLKKWQGPDARWIYETLKDILQYVRGYSVQDWREGLLELEDGTVFVNNGEE